MDESRAAQMVRVIQYVLKVVSETSLEQETVAADIADLLEVYLAKR